MRKKGDFLAENTLSAFVAFIGLVILVVGFTVACSRITADEETEAAKDTATLIKGKADALLDGQSTKSLVRGIKTSAGAWYVVGFSKNEIGAPENDECFFNSCVCVCREGTYESSSDYTFVKKRFSIACQDTKIGFCRKIDEDKISVKTYSVEDATKTFPKTADGPAQTVKIGEEDRLSYFIILPNDAKSTEIKFEKNGSEMTLTHYSSKYLEQHPGANL